jgi:hypothetical protein
MLPATWINFLDFRLSKEASTKEYVLDSSIYVKLKSKQNTILWYGSDRGHLWGILTGKGHEGASLAVLEML